MVNNLPARNTTTAPKFGAPRAKALNVSHGQDYGGVRVSNPFVDLQ